MLNCRYEKVDGRIPKNRPNGSDLNHPRLPLWIIAGLNAQNSAENIPAVVPPSTLTRANTAMDVSAHNCRKGDRKVHETHLFQILDTSILPLCGGLTVMFQGHLFLQDTMTSCRAIASKHPGRYRR